MPIPKEILAVKRPINTLVVAYGKEKNRYAVRQRIGCKNVNGRHLPINGPTIGHIIDGEYVPLVPAISDKDTALNIDLKDWANITLCDEVFKSIQEELFAVYNPKDAMKLYCISLLRVCNPGIKDCELKEAYETSFLSEIYPDVALSKNTVSKFLEDLGKTCSRIALFMKNRADSIHQDHHILLDGTLKSDESKVNSLADFSRRALTKGSRDVSVLYAFDLEAMEPICSKCFPGNMLDLTSYEAFISENGITKGFIVADKGFPSNAAESQFQDYPGLHYLNPVRSTSKLIDAHKMLDFNHILQAYVGVTCRKEKCVGTQKWLYSYRDSAKAAQEEQDWLYRAKEDNNYTLEELRRRQTSFGTIVLESDLDLPSEIVYKAYAQRWEIEIVMRYYKSACEYDETRVQDDYAVIGSEFCDFLSTVLTFRLIHAFDKANLLEHKTYKEIVSILAGAKKVRLDGGEWKLIRVNPSHLAVLQQLELLPKPEETPKKKRGRPRKSSLQSN